MSQPYRRIISLVPSLTELIADLGLESRLAGRTRFCIHPEEIVDRIPIMGGTKNPRIDDIVEARPDLVIANKEENKQKHIRELQQRCDAPIDVTDIATIEDALLAIHRLGSLLGAEEAAGELVQSISRHLQNRPGEAPLRTAYFIWKEPWMSVGGDTYIHDVMAHWNLENIFGHKKRYPEFALADLASRNPELILLSSEPYPFKEKHLEEVREACPDARVLPVEGEWFSWYGSRMQHAFERLNVWRKAIA